MTGATTADLEERANRRLERFRRVTYRSFMFAAFGFLLPGAMGLWTSYERDRIPLLLAFAATAGLGVLLWFYLRLVQAGLAGGASRRDLLLSGAATAVLSLMILAEPLMSVVPVAWASAVVLSPLSRRAVAALCLGTGTFCGAIATVGTIRADLDDGFPWYGAFPALTALYTAICALVAYLNTFQRRMWDLHLEAHAARDALARLAVTEERLRFSRDLHDLLGHSLSLIAVKSELALRMAETDPARAVAEMADVRSAARGALREVRAAVHGYRAVELDAELAGVRAVLEAAGVRCDIAVPPDGLPPDVRAVLAWVIREGATNILKHSEARRCGLAVTVHGGSVVLEMRNDGVRGDGPGDGSGLTGLRERVAVVGGELTAGRHGRDGFLLRAVVPCAVPAVSVP